MKINKLETHDRREHFIKDQEANIFQGAEDCLKKNPLSLKYQDKSPYIYIFAHPRTADNGVDKRLLWQPRFVKPRAEPNSYLFRAISHTDLIEICWILPPEELWDQYDKGKVCESDIVLWSINTFRDNRRELERPMRGDHTDERAWKLFKEVVDETEKAKPKMVEASSPLMN